MKQKGITIHNNNTISEIEKIKESCKITLSSGQELSVEMVMGATGRIPKISGLGLKNIGVQLGQRGEILVNQLNQTNIKSIYAIGAFADREFGGMKRFISYENVPSAVFSQPSIAVVGLNYEEAKKQNINAREYKSEFRALKNTISGNLERTLMKLVVDQDTQRVVGAHMIGPDAAEIIQGVAIAIKAGALKSDFDSTIGIHPSAAEEFVTMRS